MNRSLSLLLFVTVLSACGDDPMEIDGLPTLGLVAHFSFTSDASDLSGDGNDGTLLGGATANGELLVGSNDLDALALPGPVLNELVSFTVSAFVRIDDLHGGNHQLISVANAVQDDEAGVWYREATNEWVFGFDGDEDATVVNPTVEDGGWHHVAVVRSTSIAVFYLNGLQIGTPQVVADFPLVADPLGVVVGQDQDSVRGDFDANDAWAGAIDNLRIYSRPLDAAEVATLAGEAR